MKSKKNDVPKRLAIVFICASLVIFFQFLGANISFRPVDKQNIQTTSGTHEDLSGNPFGSFLSFPPHFNKIIPKAPTR